MRVVILENEEQVSRRAADVICNLVTAEPKAVLGLATGGTPVGAYRELVQRYQHKAVSFADVTTFNLDEYVGLSKDHPQSYHTFMRDNLFDATNFNQQRCHIPDGMCEDWMVECERYERLIDDSGGIDLQLLGIGTDGHIAFNEPGSSLASRTRIKALTQQTRLDNARFFESAEDVPRVAITMGIGTILEARHVLLLATGDGKAAAVRAFIEGPVSAQMPASALQLHPQVTVLLDKAAAAWLTRKDYYAHVEAIQAELESE